MLIMAIKINITCNAFNIFHFNLLLCIYYRKVKEKSCHLSEFRCYIVHLRECNASTHVRIQLYCKAAAFAWVNTKQTAWTRLIPYVSNFIVTHSQFVIRLSCTNEHRPLCVCPNFVNYAKNNRHLDLCDFNLFAVWGRNHCNKYS